jgi:hypothetical protein
MGTRNNLEGKRFGNLVVGTISEISRNGHSRWNVVCDCGVMKTVLGTHLIQNKTMSCGCFVRKRKPYNWNGYGKVSGTYWSSLNRGANGAKGRAPIEFSITIEYIADLFDKQNGKCYYTGMSIDFKSKTASLDRISSGKGYVKDNVHWVHKDINMCKRHYSEEYFLLLCKLVTENNKTSRSN